MTHSDQCARTVQDRSASPTGDVTGLAAIPTWPWRATLAASAVMLLYLGGCATRPSAPAAELPVPATQVPPAKSDTPRQPSTTTPSGALLDFQNRQHQAAEAAEKRGHWADALSAWDVLLALNPEDANLRRRRDLAQQSATRIAQDKLQAARAAQRSDGETATRLYLEVLALTPTNTEAADALRQLERDRVRRQHLGQLARNVLTRRGGDTTGSLAAAPLPNPPRNSNERNDLEHASLLAGQGEIESAIQLIRPLAQVRNADSAARLLLADLYFRQAESLAGSDKPAAIAALEQCLQTDPGHGKAASRLRELRGTAPPANPATKTIPRKPDRATSR